MKPLHYKRFFLPLFVAAVYSFLYVPMLIMLIFSFNKATLGYAWQGFTLDWYKQLLQSIEIWTVFKNSLIVATAAVALSLTLGVALIWGLNRRHQHILSLFYATIMIPEIVISVGLLTVFVFFQVPLGLVTLIAGHTLLGLGFVIPIVHIRFNELDRRLIEASLDLGASMGQTFFKVVLPFLLPALIASGLLVFIISLDDFLISFFCSSATSQTLSLYIYSTIRAGVSPVINALSAVMLFSSSILVLIFLSLSSRLTQENS